MKKIVYHIYIPIQNVTFPKTKQKKIKKLKRYTCHIVQYNEYFIITISLLLQLAKLNPLVFRQIQ